MLVLVDSSVWIQYFKSGEGVEKLDSLIDRDVIVTNKIILAELVPFLKIKKQNKLVTLFQSLRETELNINWDEIIEIQYKCLKAGINGIGIPDLIIAQNAFQNKCKLYTLDRHFNLLQKVLGIELFS
ncbi:PIN domain-containing protein [Deferribacter autotrophicus]|uniref:PIN domain-containing protein n=1 Tax=Deferribacter autotrophicus TaxID=500465 RepID=A0A5A8F2N3_9BACT|nr:PIN domain-containing protein [Deferribacter autotrophicus]KAA0257667.1 PIN domain-containing protein [Deferribacter autotrophicus]